MLTPAIKNLLRPLRNALQRLNGSLNPFTARHEIDTLYSILYNASHDLEQAMDLCATQTKDAFASQWQNLPEGEYLLTDPWFKSNVARILSEEELQLKPEWFIGKEVLDAGCGNGRWSYGLAQLGANVTSVDINQVAVECTAKAMQGMPGRHEQLQSDLESLSRVLPSGKKFDLVFSWGVIHHAKSFNRSLRQLIDHVKDNGAIYLYLYGRESMSQAAELRLFKERLRYNSLNTLERRQQFLLQKARGDRNKVHAVHDIFAPLINRRLTYDYVDQFLRASGFTDVERTLDHTELFVRGLRGPASEWHDKWTLPKKQAPYWFQHHDGRHAA